MYDLDSYTKDSQIVKQWIEDNFITPDVHDTRSSAEIEEILTTLKDKNQSRQIRHYIKFLCSIKDDRIGAFCGNLLPNYFFFYILAMIDNKLQPTMHKWTNNFYKKLASSSHSLEKSLEQL